MSPCQVSFAEFAAAQAVVPGTPLAVSMPDPSADAGLVAQSSGSSGECACVAPMDDYAEFLRLRALADQMISVPMARGSAGCYVLLARANCVAPQHDVVEHMRRVEALRYHAAHAIGAGC